MAFKKNKNKKVKKGHKQANQSSDEFDLFDTLEEEPDLGASSYPGSSYEDFDGIDIDDDILGLPADSSSDQEVDPEKKKKAIIVFALFIIVLVGALVFSMMSSSSPATVDETNQSETEQQDSRVEGRSDGTVINEELGVSYEGNVKGAPINGTGAILAFDYAYYVDRDGAEVMEYFNPDVTSYDAAYVQSHIDRVPGGTTHNLKVTPRQIGVSYEVELTLNLPGAEPVKYLKNVETMEVEGTYYVKTFTTRRMS